MAEAFAFAASVISVASLAIQIGDSLRVAIEFWDSIQDAPEELRRVSMQLRLLADYMVVIQYEHRAGQMDDFQEQLVKNALTMMKKDVDKLASVVSDLSQRMSSAQDGLRRQWGRIQIVLKEGKISRFRDHVESAISVLTLLQTGRSQTTLCRMNGKIDMIAAALERKIVATTPKVSKSPTTHLIHDRDLSIASKQLPYHEGSGSARTSTECFLRTTFQSTDKVFGLLRITSVSRQYISSEILAEETENSEHSENVLTLNILLKFGSCRKGFKLRINNTFDDWCLNSLRRLPNESLVFKLCEEGNCPIVERLFASRKASVYDVNENGQSALHIACNNGHSKICQFLIDQGADVLQTDDLGKIPLQYSSPRTAILKLKKPKLSECSETWDVLVRNGQCNPFTLPYNYSSAQLQLKSWQYVLAENPFFASASERLSLISLAMAQFQSFDDKQYVEIHDFLFSHYEKTVASGGLPENYPSPLLHRLLRGWMTRDSISDRRTVISNLRWTTDLHRRNAAGRTALDLVIAFNCGDEPKKVTLINKWIALLSDADINLHKYGQTELELHPDGLIIPRCCREIKAEILFGRSNDIQINVTENRIKAQYQSLDPDYMCEAWCGRESCLSKVDGALIKDGRPIQSIPGSWEKPLKPNSKLGLRYGLLGLRYCNDN